MKKKYREIVVNNINYGWVVNDNCDGYGGNMLVIYFDKRIIYEELFDGIISITPKMISQIIYSLND